MKIHALLLTSALLAASVTVSAQPIDANANGSAQAGAPSSAATGVTASTGGAKGRAANQPAAARPAEVDLTTLAPKDSSQKMGDEVRSGDRFDRHGVNCSLYPARCQ